MRVHSGLAATLITAAAIFLFMLLTTTLPGKSAPVVPKGIFHDSVINDAGCVTCHTPGRQAPLRLTHTPSSACMTCHRLRTGR